jgi:predicted RNase H-like nuclease (RuvC/YqgF family)
MTSDERFERIEHINASIAEERRRDREEYKALWRDSERQMTDLRGNVSQLATEVSHLAGNIRQLAVETRLRNEELRDLIDQQGREFRAADKQLGGRIESLVSAIGQFIARQ